MSQHEIDAEFEIKFQLSGMPDDEREVAYPKARIVYRYAPARPAYTPPGEYAPIDPPEPADVDLISATLLDGDGLDPTPSQLREWAEDWLNDIGYELACDHADAIRQPDPDRWLDERRDERNAVD